MSNTPSDAGTAAPDLEAEELASKHGISLEEAQAVIAGKGHERSAKDGAAEQMKTDRPVDPATS